MLKRLSLFFVCLLLFSFVAEAFHHHDDGEEHDDCPVCMAVVHNKADTGFTFAPPEIQRELTETIYVSPALATLPDTFFILELGRSPPV